MSNISVLTRKGWFRILIPLLLVLVWLVIGSIGGPTFGKLSNVSSNNQANFLPASAESTKVANLQNKFYSSNTIPAIVIIKLASSNQLNRMTKFLNISSSLSAINGVARVPESIIGPIPSKDRLAVEYIVQINSNAKINNVVNAMRTKLGTEIPQGATAYVTGPAGLSADLITAFGGIDGILLIVALLAVFIILIIVYRSIFLPFLVLINAMLALCGAILFVYILAHQNVIKLNGQSQGILSILVIGAATDYSLLLVSRFKEALEHTKEKWQAISEALRRSIEPIAASAATVILSLLCLLFSNLNSNRSLGPIAALGIAFAFLSTVSLMPAFLVLFGRNAFWPFKPKLLSLNSEIKYNQLKNGLEDRSGIWHKIPLFVSINYRKIWIILTIVLLVCSYGLIQLKANGVTESATILGKSNAVAGQSVEAEYFPAGSGTPVEIITPVKNSSRVIKIVGQTSGIISTSYFNSLQDKSKPEVIDGKVLINATLAYNPDSQSAENVVTKLRSQLKSINNQTLVGGATAINLDTNNTAKTDLHKIIPIVLLVILFILMILLRSIVAPILLVISVVLSFAASLGVSAIVFNHIFHFPGADASVPLFGFIFLVALGIDYNIFLMTRVREESKKLGTRPGTLRGLSLTGGVITSAGIVLAATFGALAIIPILFLAQIAFIVSFGVLLDTIIVRSLLVPAISFDIAKQLWWPSKI